MSINFYKKRIFNFLTFPIVLYLALFEINILNKEINSEKKLMAATEKDLYLYKGMGASYLCIASKAGIEFPKALGVASATYDQVIERKHGGLVKEIGDKKLKRENLFAGAEFQIITTALQYCPDSVPKDVTKKVKKILKNNKK